MDPLRWQRVEAIFAAVVDTPGEAARAAAVTRLSGGDEGLAADVLALLAMDDRLGSGEPGEDRHVGLRLGSYAVGALIARGGMASVYEARRADDQFQQRTAVKVMDVRLSDPDLVAQFRQERQILATLEHPAITRLLDGGVTAFGEPYLVMELVNGVPIDRYCDERRLELPARVRLFVDVCAGIAYAHRSLVLHRDLKPSNILVTAEGQPKVVDFGTATALQPERLTTVSRAPLTPAYASPEQLKGEPVGTGTDQYSLGLVLYELLTGSAPFGRRHSLISAVERALAGAGPQPPHENVTMDAAAARNTSVKRLRGQLTGDLNRILTKATASDPAARYSSVQHFADDLARWLRGEAILARPPSVTYRAGRFVLRHAAAVATATILLLSLVAATVVSLQQAARASHESAKARELNRFLTQMLSSANPSWVNANAANAGSITVRQILDGAGQLLEAQQMSSPEVEAEMRRAIGRTYAGIGATEEADLHLRRALVLSGQSGDSVGTAYTQGLLAGTRLLRGDFAEAERTVREALTLVRAHGDGGDPDLLPLLNSELGTSIAYQRPGDPEAIARWREAIAAARPDSALAPVVLQNLSIALIRNGRLDEGEDAARDALRRMNALPLPPPERASVLRTLGVLLWQQGRYEEAEHFAREAVEFAARTRPPDHPAQPNYRVWWGRTLVAAGQLERGAAVLQEAYDGYRKIRPADHMELALPLVALGSAFRLQGRLIDAERTLREGEAILRRYPAQRDRTADMAGELGLTLQALGRPREAEALLRESHDILQDAYGEDHPLTREARGRLTSTDVLGSRRSPHRR